MLSDYFESSEKSPYVFQMFHFRIMYIDTQSFKQQYQNQACMWDK
jgi:hypothetical protein